MENNTVENIKDKNIGTVSFIFNIIILIFYYMFYLVGELDKTLPLYLYLFIIYWLLINIICTFQVGSKSKKVDKFTVTRYFIVNILCGYSVVIAFASIYIMGAESNGYDVFDYWLYIVEVIALSWLGIHIRQCSKRAIFKWMDNKLFLWLGVILKIIALGMIIYLGKIVPTLWQENYFVWGSIVVLIAFELLIVDLYGDYFKYLRTPIEELNNNNSKK